MLTGDIRNQVDTIWNSFWTGGISNPLEVIEQITYLLLSDAKLFANRSALFANDAESAMIACSLL